jgi:hypothetical protein
MMNNIFSIVFLFLILYRTGDFDLVLGLNMAEKGEISEYVKNLRDTLVEVHSLSRTNIKRAQMRQKKNYDVNINYRTLMNNIFSIVFLFLILYRTGDFTSKTI